MRRREIECSLRSTTIAAVSSMAVVDGAPASSLETIGSASLTRWIRCVVVFAVDNEKRPLPPGSVEEMNHYSEELLHALDRRTSRWRGLARKRPVHHESPPLDHRARHRSPVARIARAVAVVAHGEIRVRRHRVRAELISGAIRLRQRRLIRVHLRILMENIGLIQRLPVNRDHLVADLDLVARHADDTLDEISIGLERVTEDDDVAPPDLTDRHHPRQRAETIGAVNELVDDDVVADLEVVFHRPRRDLECLENEDTGEVDEDDCDQQRLVILARRRFLYGLIC